MKKRSFTYREIATFCQEMALMLHAGIGVAAGMDLLMQEETDRQWSQTLSGMLKTMDEGEPFSTAMKRENCFPTYMTIDFTAYKCF